jgi:asparagine synthase (glutamine-hydrolysing)
MSAALAHRGPDGEGEFIADGVGLAHRRLSIIDLEGGHQPMLSPQGVVLVFNGEIYNFQEIRRDLQGLGHTFLTRSDTEVILAAYRQWGTACLDRLRGMFAFALWDARGKYLFVARDRVGIKPLYYATVGGVFYFASEAKALLTIPGFRRRLNREALPLYLTFRYTPGEETLFAGIRKLLPGHSLRIAPGQEPKIARYWQLSYEPDEGPGEGAWKERFWGLFEESVRLRMISDVPLGAYLSGGLDSSLIVAAMSALSERPVETFSVGFRDDRVNEIPYAREVAERFGARHHILHAEEEAHRILDPVIYHLDEPLGDLATIPTYLMARETKPHVTVVLSGEGADELLAGYPKYRAFLFGRKAAGCLPAPIWSLGARFAPGLTLQKGLESQSERDPVRAYLNLAAVFSRRELSNLLLKPELQAEGQERVEAVVRPHFNPGIDGLSRLLSLDFHTWLPDDLLLKNDKMTMAHAIEARVPYLDHRLVELCARIPSRFKLGWRQEKLLLRRVMAGRVPASIERRRKTGFTVPLAQWYSGDFRKQIDIVLSEDFVQKQGLFSPQALNTLRQQPLDHPYYRRQFWTVAALGLWQKKFGVEG